MYIKPIAIISVLAMLLLSGCKEKISEITVSDDPFKMVQTKSLNIKINSSEKKKFFFLKFKRYSANIVYHVEESSEKNFKLLFSVTAHDANAIQLTNLIYLNIDGNYLTLPIQNSESFVVTEHNQTQSSTLKNNETFNFSSSSSKSDRVFNGEVAISNEIKQQIKHANTIQIRFYSGVTPITFNLSTEHLDAVKSLI